MENVYNCLDKVVSYIKNSQDYKNCELLKERLDSNDEVKELIVRLKNMQKKYIRSNYDSNIKTELDNCNEKLLEIPIYQMYIKSLENVNEMIEYVKERLNKYFDSLLNSKKD